MGKHQKLAMTLTLALALSPGVYADGVKLGYDDKSKIIVEGQPVYPEGIAYDPAGKRFFVGSSRFGHLFTVDEKGELKQFSSDERIPTTLGIKVDAPRNRIVAAVADFGSGINSKAESLNNLAAAAVFDLADGKLVDFHDLTGLVPGPEHLANDVAVDAQGNIYVTDSLVHVIYKIDTAGAKSVFLKSDQFVGKNPGFTLNGIDVHSDGFLLVAAKSDGKLFKVPLDDPEKFNEVKLPEPITAVDGILLAGGDVVVIKNRVKKVVGNEIVVLRSDVGWASAAIVDRKPHEVTYPTNATLRDGQIMTVQSRLFWLMSTLKDKPDGLEKAFQIHTLGSVSEAQ